MSFPPSKPAAPATNTAFDANANGFDLIAVDFGTSNTAVAVLQNGQPLRIPVEAGSDTLPTAVFFPPRGEMLIGEAAAEALIAGDEGRYMRALKSVLGTPLLHEARLIGGKRRTIADVITAFLVELSTRVEAKTGMRPRRVLSGRPVHFHSDDAGRDARAEDDLRACYMAAGFTQIDFLPEPEAAALACGDKIATGAMGLVVDIGGGTSDFTVFRRVDEGAGQRVETIASHGIRLGGTDFDHAVSMAHAMPRLGRGGDLRREMGAGLLPVPNGIYADLATWAKIPFLYTPDTRREVAQMAKLAIEPKRLKRLQNVLEDELGHELAFAVERGKIAANAEGAKARIEMAMVEPGLSAPISKGSMDMALQGYRDDLAAAISRTLDLAGVTPDSIGHIVLVGGSSLMRLVEDMAIEACPKASVERSEAFTAVVDGLALATATAG